VAGRDDTKEHKKHIQASPLYWVTPDAAPTLLLHGTKDPYVNVEQAEWIRDRLKAAEVEVELIAFEGAATASRRGPGEALKAMVDFFDKHLKSAK